MLPTLDIYIHIHTYVCMYVSILNIYIYIYIYQHMYLGTFVGPCGPLTVLGFWSFMVHFLHPRSVFEHIWPQGGSRLAAHRQQIACARR